MAVLESQLRITAVDETKATFDAIEAHIRSLSQTVASASKAVGNTDTAVGAVNRNAVLNPGRLQGFLLGPRSRAEPPSREPGSGGSGIAGAVAGMDVYVASAAAQATIRAISERQHETTRMAVAGETPAEIADAEAQTARLAAEFPSISQTDLLHMLRNARSIVGTYKEAADIAEPLVKLRTLAQLARPGEDVSEDFDKLIKGLEIKGVTQNPQQFQEYMEGIAKGINVFGDTLRPYEYYEMFKYGRQASAALSEKFILGTGPTLAQELGGEGFGAAVAQFNRLLVSGVGKKSSFVELARLGLIRGNVANIPGTGEGQGLEEPGDVLGWHLAQSDPNEWVKQYLLPAFDKAGIKDKDEQLREIGVIFQSQRAGQLVDLLATQQPRIEKDTALLANAPGLSAADKAIHEDPGLAWQGLKSSIDSLVGTTGESVKFAGVVTDAAQAISRFTQSLTREQADEGALDMVARKAGWLAHPSEWMGPPPAADRAPGAAPPASMSISGPAPGRDPRSPSVGPYAYHPTPPAPPTASVIGQVQIDHTVNVDLKVDSMLRVINVTQSRKPLEFIVPLTGDGAGTGAAVH